MGRVHCPAGPGPGGLRVLRLAHGSSAARRAGAQAGDVIVSVDGHAATTPFALRWQLEQKRWNDRLVLRVLRSGRVLTLTVTLRP